MRTDSLQPQARTRQNLTNITLSEESAVSHVPEAETLTRAPGSQNRDHSGGAPETTPAGMFGFLTWILVTQVHSGSKNPSNLYT